MNREVPELLQNIEDVHFPSGPTYQSSKKSEKDKI